MGIQQELRDSPFSMALIESVTALHAQTDFERAIADHFTVPEGDPRKPLDIRLDTPGIKSIVQDDGTEFPVFIRKAWPTVVTWTSGERAVLTMEYQRQSPFSADWQQLARAYGESKAGDSIYVPQFTEDELRDLDKEMLGKLGEGQDRRDGIRSPLALVDADCVPNVHVRNYEESVSVGIFDADGVTKSERELEGEEFMDYVYGNLEYDPTSAREVWSLNRPLILDPGESPERFSYELTGTFTRLDQEVSKVLHSSRPKHFNDRFSAESPTKRILINASVQPIVVVELFRNVVAARTL